MISSGDHQLGLRQAARNLVERLNHEFQTLVGSPLSEGQDPMDRVSASRKIGELRPARKNPVGSQVNIIAAVLVVQDLAIARHQDGHGI
jgi:hypothetical protein